MRENGRVISRFTFLVGKKIRANPYYPYKSVSFFQGSHIIRGEK